MKHLIIIISLFILNIAYIQNATFNKQETLKFIEKGNSTIAGEAFAKDNQAPIKGIAIININKKIGLRITEILNIYIENITLKTYRYDITNIPINNIIDKRGFENAANFDYCEIKFRRLNGCL